LKSWSSTASARRPQPADLPRQRPLLFDELVRDGATLSTSTLRTNLVILVTMTMMPLGEAKAHLSELVSRVHDHHERVTVTVHGRPSAVLLAVADLERLEETLAVLSDPATLRRLVESDAELARGEAVSADELAEAMARRGSPAA
jgi:antitoxin YefM